MTDTIDQVRAGDLIRADDYNRLIRVVNDLSARVARLEATGPGSTTGTPVILAVNPLSPRVGDTVVVTGSGFDFTVGAARVSVDGLDCTLLAGSSDTVLIFQLPAIASVPGGGRTAQLLVSNLQSSTSRSLLVLPQAPVLQGSVALDFQDTLPTVITLNQQCVFRFKAVSTANAPVQLTLTPTISVPAWQAGLQILDDGGAVNPGQQLIVGPLLSKDFFVRVAQVTAAATSFSLTVNGQGQGILTSSGAQAFTVGQIGAQDLDTDLLPTGVVRSGPGPDPLSGSVITLKPNEGAEVDLLVKISRLGHFDLTGTISPAGSGWTLTQLPVGFDVQASDIATGGPDAGWFSKAVQVVIKAPANPGTASLVLTLARPGAPVPRTRTFQLVAQA
jgi:hypothetical protein